jgi:hypothetical protein
MTASHTDQQPGFEVSIAAHYVPARIPFLGEVLRAIADWDRPRVNVTLVTQDLAIAEETEIRECAAALEERGFTLDCDLTHGMAHPWHLTWWHKQALRDWHARPDGHPGDLFMYIEDDIVVDRDNIAYFERYLEPCKARGVMPGFLRFEKGADGTRISPDYRGYQAVQPQQRMEINGQSFVAPEFPYWAGFILDRELCSEYFASPWSDLETADALPQSQNHSCRVQSAWALTYEDVPKGLPSRFVVPVNEELVPLENCQVWHSANNYSVSKQYNFGTVKMDDILQNSPLVAGVRQAIWDAGALRRRATDKIKREAKRFQSGA